jgi:DNA-binding NtrC family response regulator
VKNRILLIDDEPLVVQVTQQLLERIGYRVIPFTKSPDALQSFQAAPEAFDLVITDMRMPDLDGAALSQALKEIRPDIPIILCTGFCESITAEKALALGIKEFMIKPVQLNDLAPAVERALNQMAG